MISIKQVKKHSPLEYLYANTAHNFNNVFRILCERQTVKDSMKNDDTLNKNEEQWKQELTTEQYTVLRECETEPPFTGKYYKYDKKGTYHCAACDAKLFNSDTKYDSGSGWPSFYEAIDKEAIIEELDTSFDMRRIKLKCAECNSHLGHVFPDGPNGGLRYCVNSISLDFIKQESEKENK